VLFRESNRFPHDKRIARVESAGDIGRRDERHHGFIITKFILAETFTHVAVEIDFH